MRTPATWLPGAALAAALLCAAAGAGSAARVPAPAHACPTSAGMADKSKVTKPSSFAPGPRSPNNAYGAPVGGKILTRRVPPKKKEPELRSSPLPQSP